MDADPWADAPSTPRLDDNTPQASPSKPARPSPNAQDASTLSPPFASPNGRLPSDHDEPVRDVVSSPVDLSPTEHAEHAAGAEGGGDGGDGGFDDFDDFDEPAAGPSTLPAPGIGEDDGFGDFGDFEEGDEVGEAFEDGQSAGALPPVTSEREWAALRLDPFPSASSLRDGVHSLLLPLASGSSSSRMTDEPPREVGGLGQIMISESSREAYAQLTTPPMLKSLDWTRSRVRREHLISMGVPVNLDEVDSHRLSSLPPLRITTSHGTNGRPGEMGPPPVPRPASVDGRRLTTDQKGKNRISLDQPANGRGNGIQSGPASAVPRSGTRDNYGLEPRPALDMTKAENLCGLDESALSLINIDKLRVIQNDLVDTSAQASAVLAWLLQLKDAQTQDSATYNGMISELIANAAKAKQAQSSSSGGVFRRSSLQQRPQSSSGNITPGRTGSPAMR